MDWQFQNHQYKPKWKSEILTINKLVNFEKLTIKRGGVESWYTLLYGKRLLKHVRSLQQRLQSLQKRNINKCVIFTLLNTFNRFNYANKKTLDVSQIISWKGTFVSGGTQKLVCFCNVSVMSATIDSLTLQLWVKTIISHAFWHLQSVN